MIKPTLWNGKDLKGRWHVTIKIDGVRALWDAELKQWLSRAGTPLNNCPAPYIDVGTGRMYPGVDCELYLGSLKDTNRAWRTIHLKPDTPRIERQHLYSLDPIDPRLDLGFVEDPAADWIVDSLKQANELGYEGLVLRQGDKAIKVKPHDNFDVLVKAAVQGTGKHSGRMGYLETHMGDVGTGFSDLERDLWWREALAFGTAGHTKDGLLRFSLPLTPITIEVECMQLTPDGKFRHARFIRERFDKIAET